MNAAGTAIIYTAVFGGSLSSVGVGIAIDSLGSAYVTGSTFSPDFPVTPGAFQTVRPGDGSTYHVFVTRLNPAGNELSYSTYIGGIDFDTGMAIAVDASGNAIITATRCRLIFPPPRTPSSHPVAGEGRLPLTPS